MSKVHKTSESSQKLDEELEMFKWSPSISGIKHFVKAQKKLVKHVSLNYPHVEEVLMYGKDHEFKDTTIPSEYESLVETAKEFELQETPQKKALFEEEEASGSGTTRMLEKSPGGVSKQSVMDVMVTEERKLIIKDRHKYRNNKKLVYNLIWDLCTTDLQDLIKGVEDYDDMAMNRDLIQLWKYVKDVCLTGGGISAEESKRAAMTRKNFESAYQLESEELGDFYERYKVLHEALLLNGDNLSGVAIDEDIKKDLTPEARAVIQKKADEKEQRKLAAYFLEKLNRRKFEGLILHLANSFDDGRDNYPKTLTEAYQRARKWELSSTVKKASDVVEKKKPATVFAAPNVKEKSKTKAQQIQKKESTRVIKCYLCGEEGHKKSECPKVKGQHSIKNPDKGIHSTFNIANTNGSKLLDDNQIIFDSGAILSVFYNRLLLSDIEYLSKPYVVRGVGGNLSLEMKGLFMGCIPVYYNPNVVVNILSQSDLKEFGDVHYDSLTNTYVATIGDTHLMFDCIDKLYVTRYNQAIVQSVVKQNETEFSKVQLSRAKEVRDIQMRLGYPSNHDLKEVLKKSNLGVTSEDVDNAEAIYGPNVEMMKGKTTRKSSKHVEITSDGIVLCLDIFFIAGVPFLLSISRSLCLQVVTYLKDRSAESVAEAIKSQLSTYKSRGYVVTHLLVDGESAIKVIQDELQDQGIFLNIATPGEHVPEIERAGRLLKERVRCYWNASPYQLDITMLDHLVKFCVQTINLFPKKGALDNKSPRELFLNQHVDYEAFCRLSWGEYCQVYAEEKITNTMNPRTIGAIALSYTGNLQGGFYFLNINTWKVISRRSWNIIPMTDDVIAQINKQVSYSRPLVLPTEDDEGSGTARFIDEVDEDMEIDVSEPFDSQEIVEEQPTIVELEKEEQDIGENKKEYIVPYNLRERRSTWKDRYINVVANISLSEAIRNGGEPAMSAIMKELQQMYDKEVFHPVIYDSLSEYEKQRIIMSFMFLKLKSNGVVKARLVADGSGQLSSDYPKSSPTVSLEVLMLSIALDIIEQRHVVTMDIEGAYLHAKMPVKVIMKLDRRLSAIYTVMHEEYEEYLHKNNLYVELDKALYGCIESARLFYEHMSGALIDLGFTRSKLDPCLFIKNIDGVILCVIIHVDDLKVSSSVVANIHQLYEQLENAYTRINMEDHIETGNEYLGFRIQYATGVAYLSMNNHIDDVIDEMEGHLNQNYSISSPGDIWIFKQSEIDEDNDLLPQNLKRKFHRIVAKLLFVSKRVRPDLLLVISYLSTRVSEPTCYDWLKLVRCVRYLRNTRKLCLILKPSELKIIAYIDASFNSYGNGIGQSGSVITIGDAPISFRSTKQKIVTKSSAEAELYALAEEGSRVIGMKNIMNELGYDIGPALIYTDSKSAIAMLENGRPISNRSKHINLRYFFLHDRIKSGEVDIKFIPSEQMKADFLTKPLVGREFKGNISHFLYEPP